MAFKFTSQGSVPLPQEKRQQFLLVILGVAVLIALVVLYFGFWRSSPPVTSPLVSSDDGEAITGEGIPIQGVIQKIDFDIDFLKDTNFQALKIYGEWPLEVGEKGRDNPFVPF